MSIYDAGRTFTAAHLHVAAAAGNWSPYYLAYAWLTGVIDPRAAYERDHCTHLYEAWVSIEYARVRARHSPALNSQISIDAEVLVKLAEDIVNSESARSLLRDYATLHGQRGAPG